MRVPRAWSSESRPDDVQKHASSTFSNVIGQPLLATSHEYALCLVARIDELYLTEQELLWDSEVCALGRLAASAILDGVDAATAFARAKGAAWKLEAEAAEGLMVRFKARDDDGVPIEELRRDLQLRRQRASKKLFKWFDRVERALDRTVEAARMREVMGATISHIEQEYASVAEMKTDLSLIFYQLQEALQELLRSRREVLLPHLERMCKITTRRTGRVIGVIRGLSKLPALRIPGGLACTRTSVGSMVSASTVDSVVAHLQEKRLSAAFHKDELLCERVQAEAKQLAVHLDSLQPASFHEDSHSAPVSFHDRIGRSAVRFVPGVSLASTAIDVVSSSKNSRAGRGLVKRCMREVEGGNDSIRSLLNLVNKRYDFWQVHAASSRAVPKLQRAQSVPL